MIDRSKAVKAVLHATTRELEKLDSNFRGFTAVVVYNVGDDTTDEFLRLETHIFSETSLDETVLMQYAVRALEDSIPPKVVQ